MSTMASEITSLTIVYSSVNSGVNQRKHQSSASLVFVWPVNFPHKGPVTRKMFPFDDVIMLRQYFHPTKLLSLYSCVWLIWQYVHCLSKYRILSMHIMMTSSNGNIFRVTGPLCGEFTGYWWIPRTKASDAEFWCYLWSAPVMILSIAFRKWSRQLSVCRRFVCGICMESITWMMALKKLRYINNYDNHGLHMDTFFADLK